MKTVPLHTVNVNRDAMTKIPVNVPPYEVAVMQHVFGEDNVILEKENADTAEVDETTEGQRLVEKFGIDPVVAIYGANYKGAVARELASIDAPAKAGKARAAAPA